MYNLYDLKISEERKQVHLHGFAYSKGRQAASDMRGDRCLKMR